MITPLRLICEINIRDLSLPSESRGQNYYVKARINPDDPGYQNAIEEVKIPLSRDQYWNIRDRIEKSGKPIRFILQETDESSH